MEIKAVGNGKRFKSVYLFLISFGVAIGLTQLLREPGFTDSPLGVALEHSGLLDHYTKMHLTLHSDSIVMISILGFLAMIIANVMTNSTATALMISICMAILPAFKLEVAVIVAISSSAALVLLAASPSNAIVFNTGFLRQKDFRLTGILFGLPGPLLAILWVLFMS